MEINFVNGDATNMNYNGTKILVHVCNDIGAWGAGFVLAISKKWKEPEKEYKKWHKEKFFNDNEILKGQRIKEDNSSSENSFKLGNVQFVKVENDIWVGNMIGQRDIRRGIAGIPPVRYPAIRMCLERVANFATINNATVHMPKIGCGLAGGQWNIVEEIINETLISNNINTFVYEI